MKTLRQPTLDTIGLGSVLDIFRNGKLPVTPSEQVDKVFGPSGSRGSMVISGANGIVGAGKMMQLGSRLYSYNVPMVAIDLPNAPDGIGGQVPGLVQSFGREESDAILSNMIRLNYDGKRLPSQLKALKPKFLLEAIPEILELKKAHYSVFRETFPDVQIRSVTSGFPSSELGVGVAHPAFPHQINKIWEIVEDKPSNETQLFWALGMIPVPVSDHWSFVLDVLFCGLTHAGLQYHRHSNMPYWKIDKYVRKFLGPNPFRAHDAIGAKGANFLTHSCLHHLGQKYGPLFEPTEELTYRMESGQNWYPLNHLRPLVDWKLSDQELDDFHSFLFGPIIQMTSLLLHEKRGHLANINMIGESCAQFRKGVIALIRDLGAEKSRSYVENYHKLRPDTAKGCWFPETFDSIGEPEWQQLYVNAEHDDTVGVITISRESYNSEVDAELNRAIDWLKSEKIDRVIVTGDFHLSTQMVGADTSEFYPAVNDTAVGEKIAASWSRTARRLDSEFKYSVGYLNGKRCLGGMLELLMHCHYLVLPEGSSVGMPEVTLPVVPGMEGCHWAMRKADPKDWPKILQMLLTGRAVKASDANGWLADFVGSTEEALQMAWKLASDGEKIKPVRKPVDKPLDSIPSDIGLKDSGNPDVEIARKAIFDTVRASCQVPISEALAIQAKHSAQFMSSKTCRKGMIGSEASKVMDI